MSRRARRSIASTVLVVLGLVVGAVVLTALQAEGRERSKAETNDGGAWLLKRDRGLVGHVNRVVGEVTGAVSVADPGSDYDVDQAPGIIVVHDRTNGTASVVDPSVGRVTNPSGVRLSGRDVAVHAVDGGALIVDRASMRVWKLDREELVSVASTDEVEPLLAGEGPARSAATPDGHAVIADEGADHVVFVAPDGSLETSPALGMTDTIASVTSLGEDTAVVTDADGDIVVATPGRADALATEVTGPDGEPIGLVLQQPGPEAGEVVAATGDGRLMAIPLDGAEPTEIGQLGAGAPVEPIAYGGCVFAVATSPPTFAQWCRGADGTWTEGQREPLTGAGSELRLRLVNGWIWINDVDSGAAWVTAPQQRLDRVEDWGNILSDLDDETDDDNTDEDGGEVLTEVNPDDPNAEIVQSDEIDTEGPNRPPIARDDEAQTRVDRPIDVDVLINDTDPNGDVLVVTAIEPAGGEALIDIAPDGRSVQVSPAAGYTGLVRFGYTITDGRDASASATVTVDVRPSSGDDNRPPEAHNDIASTRRGRPTTFDVLANDVDPDGDALVLESIAPADPEAGNPGVLVLDPSGQVVFTPDPNTTSERIELAYTVSDDFGATDEGRVIVAVRLEDANNEPDARNDAGVTVVGKPVRLNVLANDTDPDNDPLFVAQLPTLVRPTDRTVDALELSLTPDGELFFNPDAPGTFVFNYSATDGEETDVAQIRIEVGAPVENRPPIAVRDDVVIPAGGSRLVYVLENDGDPDGDVVGLVGHTADDGLTVKEVEGVGYLVTVAPDAPTRPTFRYQISDGRSDPVTAVVVVAVARAATIDQPPVARADVVEVRAGGKVSVPVLKNDYDPEGGVLEVVSVTPFEGADTAPGLNGQTVDVRVAADVISSFTLSYTVADEAGNQASAFLEVRIVPADEVNRPPIARTDTARTRSGVPVLIEVVANDSDPDGDIIAAEAIRTQPTGGTARVEDGAVVYTPSETFSGTDRFTYALVDAGGEIGIGEVLVGVMPLAGENRAPEAFDDAVDAVAGSAPLIFDVLDNDADPDGDRVRVTTVGAPSSGAQGRRGRRRRDVHAAGDDHHARRRSRRDRLHVLDRRRSRRHRHGHRHRRRGDGRRADAAHRRRRPGRAAHGRPDRRHRRARQRPRSGRQPGRATVSSGDPALADRDGSVITITAGATSGRHVYTITDAAGLTDQAEVAVLVVPNRAPVVDAVTGRTPSNETITLDLAAAAVDPDGDALFFTCCDSPIGGAATTVTSGPGELTVSFDPDDGFTGPATFAFSVDDQEGHVVAGRSPSTCWRRATGRPPRRTARSPSRRACRPTSTSRRSSPTRTPTTRCATRSTDRPGDRRPRAGRRTVQASASLDRGEQTDSFTYTVTDAAGEAASASVDAHRDAAVRPAARGPCRRRHHQPGPAGHRRRARQRHRPAGPGPARRGGERRRRRHRRHGRRAGDVRPGPWFLRGDVVHLPRPRRRQRGVARVGGPGRHHGDRSAVGPRIADRRRRQRPGHGELGGAVVQRHADRRLRDPHRRGRGPLGRQPDRLHVDRPHQRRGISFNVRAHNSAGWGPWSAPSPTMSPATGSVGIAQGRHLGRAWRSEAHQEIASHDPGANAPFLVHRFQGAVGEGGVHPHAEAAATHPLFDMGVGYPPRLQTKLTTGAARVEVAEPDSAAAIADGAVDILCRGPGGCQAAEGNCEQDCTETGHLGSR